MSVRPRVGLGHCAALHAWLLALLLLGRPGQAAPSEDPDAFMRALFAELPKSMQRLVREASQRRVQVLVGELVPSPTAGDLPILLEHAFRVDDEYLYPASAIKLVATVAALHLWTREQLQGRPLTLSSPLRFCPLKEAPHAPSTAHCQGLDKSNLDGGRITLGHELRKVHLVSSNAAFNRCYDLVGHEALNQTFTGLASGETVRLHHRLGVVEEAEAGLTTPRVLVDLGKDREPYILPQRTSPLRLPPLLLPGLLVGLRYRDARGHLIPSPMDFSRKNAASLRALQRLLLGLVHPGHPLAPSLRLDESHRRFLLQAMAEDPRKSRNPRCSGAELSELRFKPMMAGILRSGVDRSELDYINKAGKALGFHIENAYLRHRRTGRAFLVAAGLFVDLDGTLNDDQYAYETLSKPFLEALGEALGRRLARPLPPQSPPLQRMQDNP